MKHFDVDLTLAVFGIFLIWVGVCVAVCTWWHNLTEKLFGPDEYTWLDYMESDEESKALAEPSRAEPSRAEPSRAEPIVHLSRRTRYKNHSNESEGGSE